MSFLLTIHGNHTDPQGNAIPYERMTQRSKWTNPRALRYIQWKSWVQTQWKMQTKRPLPSKRNQRYRLDVICYFRGEIHADPENVRKGVQDALFINSGDKHVVGIVDCFHVKQNPRLCISVSEESNER